MRTMSTMIVLALAMTGAASAEAGPVFKTAATAKVATAPATPAAMKMPDVFLPNCSDLDLEPWQHVQCKPFRQRRDFENPMAEEGVQHYQAVRSILTDLLKLPYSERTDETARKLTAAYFAAKGVSLPAGVRMGDEGALLAGSRKHASQALSDEIDAVDALVGQGESIDDFEADLMTLNSEASGKLKGKERTTFYLLLRRWRKAIASGAQPMSGERVARN